jgi:type I restriction enzyme S subunit
MPRKQEWVQTKLGSVATFTNGGAWNASEYVDSGIPVVRVTDCQNGTVDVSACKYLSEAAYAKYRKHVITEGDLIVATVGSHPTQPGSVVGRPVVVPREAGGALLNQNAVCIRPLENSMLDKHFLSNFAKSPSFGKYIIACARGSANQVRMSIGLLRDMPIELPPFSTQRKIAAILSAYDYLIENNLRRIKILEEMAQNIYREWFVKFRFPGHQQTRFVDSPLGMIPEGWEVVSLENVCSRITDGSHYSPKTTDFGYPMASVKDMHDWGINIDTCRTISEEEFQNLVRNDCKMCKDDVLIAKDGSYLKHCFVVEKDFDVALLSSIAILRPNKQINPHVLAMTLREPNMKTRMTGFVSGAALPRIILQAFRQFQIVLPHIALQERWAASAEPGIQLCWRLLSANANLRRTRDLLLPRLISGQVDVSELDIAVPEEGAC